MNRPTHKPSPTPTAPPVGVVFGSLTPPELLAEGAALAERLGFAELWFSEDCFFTGGMSGITQLLASTSTVPVRLGLASNATRHPAILAMELAGIARMYPGRSSATLGLGNTGWLDQLGLQPRRPLTALLADYRHLRALLAGEVVTSDSGHHYRGVQLGFPPSPIPPLWLGAVNGKALRSAGAVADGVLLSVLTGPTYLRWARGQIQAGAEAAGRPTPPVVAFTLTSVDPDPAIARGNVRDAVSFFANAEAHTALIGESPFSHDDVTALLASEPHRTATMIDELAVSGNAEQVVDRLNALLDAGADRIGIWPFPSENFADQLITLAHDVLPHLYRSS